MISQTTGPNGQDHDGNDRFATKKEIADFLRVTERTVESYMRTGVIPFVRMGSHSVRFLKTEIVAALREKSRCN